jgi:heme exporter protein C
MPVVKWWQALLFLSMSTIIVLSFHYPPPLDVPEPFRAASRIFYYHVPIAWATVVAYFTSMFYGIRYLKSRDWRDDQRALTAAQIGTLFCVLAAVTGAIFAKVAWGAYWNWDPRQVSIFMLLLLYSSYFALRGSLGSDHARGTLSAVYSILSLFAVPFFMFIMPRMSPSLHPAQITLNPDSTRPVFFTSVVCFTLLYYWMVNIAFRINLRAGVREREF